MLIIQVERFNHEMLVEICNTQDYGYVMKS